MHSGDLTLSLAHQVSSQPLRLDALADEVAYAARYGKQQFPFLTSRLGRLAVFNAALTRLVKRENAKPDASEE